MAAALDLLARHPTLPIPVPLSVLLGHDDVEVRLGALKAHLARQGLPPGELLDQLLADPFPGSASRSAAVPSRNLAARICCGVCLLTRTCSCGR